MPRLALVLMLACSLVASVPAPARAAEDALTRKKVQSYLDLAADLFKSGDFAGALSELKRAEELSDLAVVRFNIARCLEELHRDGEAVAAYEKYLSLQDASAGGPERQKRAQDAVARLATSAAKEVGALEIACPLSGTTVLIVGVTHTPVPCPWKSERVPPGSYEVQITAPGQRLAVIRAQVAVGRTTAIVASAGSAVPTVTSPSDNGRPPVGVRFVAQRDGDDYMVRVRRLGQSCKAPCELPLPPGRYEIEVEGSSNYSDTIDVDDASTAKIGRRRGPFLAIGIASVATGGVLAIVGFYGLYYNALNTSPGIDASTSLILLGTGAVVAVAGGIVGFKLAGKNKLDVDRGSRAELSLPRFELVAVGAAPTNGGGVVGATFRF